MGIGQGPTGLLGVVKRWQLKAVSAMAVLALPAWLCSFELGVMGVKMAGGTGADRQLADGFAEHGSGFVAGAARRLAMLTGQREAGFLVREGGALPVGSGMATEATLGDIAHRKLFPMRVIVTTFTTGTGVGMQWHFDRCCWPVALRAGRGQVATVQRKSGRVLL